MTGPAMAHLLRQAGRTAAALCLGTVAFFYLVVSSSASFFGESSPEIPFLRDPPRLMRALLGGSPDFTQPAGWMATALTHPITLALFTAAALTVAAGGVATEIERGSLDFVLSAPITRTRYLLAVVAAAVSVVTAVELAGFVTTVVSRLTVAGMDRLSVAGLARAFLGSWTMFVAFAAVAVLVSANTSLRGRAVALSVGFVIGSFLLNVTALMMDSLYPLRWLSLFHYFEPADLLASADRLADLAVPGALALVVTSAAVVTFRRRDIAR